MSVTSNGRNKGKTDAPVFDLYAKGKKGGAFKTEKPEANRALAALTTRETKVDGGNGFGIFKIAIIDLTARAELSAKYELRFEGHQVMPFDRLGEARDRAKLGAPAAAEVPETAEA
jgi:hypothetical protein